MIIFKSKKIFNAMDKIKHLKNFQEEMNKFENECFNCSRHFMTENSQIGFIWNAFLKSIDQHLKR